MLPRLDALRLAVLAVKGVAHIQAGAPMTVKEMEPVKAIPLIGSFLSGDPVMALAYWFTQHEKKAAFRSRKLRSARAISPCCMSAANGNGWFVKLAGMSPRCGAASLQGETGSGSRSTAARINDQHFCARRIFEIWRITVIVEIPIFGERETRAILLKRNAVACL